jgi:glycosyltransferase involved in cell wall biosynthesis
LSTEFTKAALRERIAVIDLGTLAGYITASIVEGLVSDSTHVTVIATSRSPYLDLFRSIPAVRLVVLSRGSGPRSVTDLFSLRRRLVRVLRVGHYDQAIDIGLSVLSLFSGRAIRPLPIARFVHDASPHPGMKDGVLFRLSLYYWRRSGSLVTLSEHTSRTLRGLGLETAVNLRFGEHHAFPGRVPELISSKRRNILFWGRIEQYKGLALLLDAFALVRRVDPAVKLRVVGRGRIDPSLRGRLLSLGVHVENRWVDHDEIGELVDWAGIVALPYDSATQSGPAAMALSNGIPVVATAVGALPEQVRDNRTGIIVPRDDPKAFAAALLRIIGDAELARYFSTSALRITQEEERWSVLGPQLLSALRSARQ